jgi:hypothetical protein
MITKMNLQMMKKILCPKNKKEKEIMKRNNLRNK